MKVTKFVHACLLVEMPGHVNRTILFDPGVMSAEALQAHSFAFLDDIVITHIHPDHCDIETISRLVQQFPDVHITATPETVSKLADAGIAATTEPSDDIVLFDSPHESVAPMFPLPQQIGVHYLDTLTHPGDSHSFHETKTVLALPMTGPWGSSVKALNLALELKPKYVLPIHDWHWNDQARADTYDNFEQNLAKHDIIFLKLATSKAVVLDI